MVMSERRQSVAFDAGRRDDLPVTRWQHAQQHLTTHWRTLLTAAGGACLLAALITQIPIGWWSTAWDVVTWRWWLTLLLATGVAGLIAGGKPGWQAAKRLGRRQAEQEPSAAPRPPDRKLRPIPTWTIPAGALLVGVVTWWAVTWLQGDVPSGGDPLDREKLRVESIRTGLSVGAGVAGGLALLIALRRQQLAERDHLLADQARTLAERAQEATEHDAAERRITELYVKAADQLGSDKAPVRLDGLYALERLAQDNPAHRQSIVDVVCAYLRMPYTAPDESPRSTHPTATKLILPKEWAPKAGNVIESDDGTQSERSGFDPQEEREVRLAAQTLLARHLRRNHLYGDSAGQADPRFWPGVQLDLSGAVLVNCGFGGCELTGARFNSVTFVGITWLVNATLRDVSFAHATFRGLADFASSEFRGHAVFWNCNFLGEAWFWRTTFELEQLVSAEAFDQAVFHKRAWFEGARVSRGRRSWRARVVDTSQAHVWPSTWEITSEAEGSGGFVTDSKEPN